MLLHTSPWLQWLLWVTVALNWLITLHILLTWHHLTTCIFCSPTWENMGSSFEPMMRSYLQLQTCFEDQDKSFYPTGIQALQHRWKKCVDRRGDYVEKQTTFGQIWPRHHSQPRWTFQPTLVPEITEQRCPCSSSSCCSWGWAWSGCLSGSSCWPAESGRARTDPQHSSSQPGQIIIWHTITSTKFISRRSSRYM